MYGIFTYIWLKFMVNVGKYTIHGSYGYGNQSPVEYSDILLNSFLLFETSYQTRPTIWLGKMIPQVDFDKKNAFLWFFQQNWVVPNKNTQRNYLWTPKTHRKNWRVFVNLSPKDMGYNFINIKVVKSHGQGPWNGSLDISWCPKLVLKRPWGWWRSTWLGSQGVVEQCKPFRMIWANYSDPTEGFFHQIDDGLGSGISPKCPETGLGITGLFAQDDGLEIFSGYMIDAWRKLLGRRRSVVWIGGWFAVFS